MSNETSTTQEPVRVDLRTFLTAWERSVKDGTGVKGVAEKTGLSEETCQARASKYRNPEYKKVDKKVSGKLVYRRAVDGDEGETETTDKSLAKLTKSTGKPVTIKVFAKDAQGNKIMTRKGLPLSTMPRGGGSRINVDEMTELLLELQAEEAPADSE